MISVTDKRYVVITVTASITVIVTGVANVPSLFAPLFTHSLRSSLDPSRCYLLLSLNVTGNAWAGVRGSNERLEESSRKGARRDRFDRSPTGTFKVCGVWSFLQYCYW